MQSPTPQADALRALHEEYVWAVNAAVANGDERLADRLNDEYTNEALKLMTSAA